MPSFRWPCGSNLPPAFSRPGPSAPCRDGPSHRAHREARKKIAGGGLGFLELAGMNEIGRGVGRRRQLVPVISFPTDLRKECGFRGTVFQATGSGALFARGLVLGNNLSLGCLLLGLATLLVLLATAAGTRIRSHAWASFTSIGRLDCPGRRSACCWQIP
jgi:hypothetical protein